MRIENVAMIGMGAVGTLYGYYLSQKLGRDKVGFIVDPERMERYTRNPATSNGVECNLRLISSQEKGKPADFVFFAVKATGLEKAMEDAANQIGPDTVILSALNGIISEKLLEERFGATNVIYSVAQGMDAVKDGSALTYTKMGCMCIGIPKDRPEKQPALDALCELFDRTGFPYTLEEDVMHRLWSKLMMNVGVNQVTMVYEGTYRTIQEPGEARDTMIAAMREVIALSEYEGVRVTEADLDFYLKLLDTLHPDSMPSMRQDGLFHRKSEVELFSGTIRRLGRKHGVPTPVNDRLYETVQRMEAEY